MIQAICWVLLHSLWQGLLLALAGGGIILSTRRSAAAVRYRLLCGLGALFLIIPGVTFFYELAMVTLPGEGNAEFVVSVNWFVEWCSEHAWVIVTGWLFIVVLKSVRVAAGWNYLRQMRLEGRSAPALWMDRIGALSEQVGVTRTVKLVESALVRVPMVIGQLKPIIYVPLGLINHLPAGEMEAVLLHELAHIRRYDHVVNMVQQIAECLLFFNPGFLWISAVIREERENSCDDVAIANTGNPVEFVRALVRFKEHSVRGAVLAFPGNRRQLLHRVLRISRQENKTLSGRERIVLLLGCLVLLGLLAARVGTAAGHKKVNEMQAQVSEWATIELHPIDVKETPTVSPELAQVLRTKQQVSQNMEWVQAQLERLHKAGHKGATREVDWNRVMVRRKLQLVEREQMEADQQRAQIDLERAQGDKEKEQGVRDREQAEQDRQQAERDRHQADLDREQAVRDQHQADLDRQQALRDREQAERDRLQAQHEREAAEFERLQGELQRKKAELDRVKPKN